jgi:hypothetical protein
MASWLARRVLAALREAERQADLVAEVLAPGPFGPPAMKSWSRETQEAAAQSVEAARRRWSQTHAPLQGSSAPATGNASHTREQ